MKRWKKLRSELGQYDVKCLSRICNSQTVFTYTCYLYFRRRSKKLSAYNNWNWLCNRITLFYMYCDNCEDDAMHKKYQIKISARWNCECTQCIHHTTRFNSLTSNNAAAVIARKMRRQRREKNPHCMEKSHQRRKVFVRVHFSCFSFFGFFSTHRKGIGGTWLRNEKRRILYTKRMMMVQWHHDHAADDVEFASIVFIATDKYIFVVRKTKQ